MKCVESFELMIDAKVLHNKYNHTSKHIFISLFNATSIGVDFKVKVKCLNYFVLIIDVNICTNEQLLV